MCKVCEEHMREDEKCTCECKDADVELRYGHLMCQVCDHICRSDEQAAHKIAAFTVNVKPYLPEAHTDKEENKDNMYFNIALALALANNDEMLKSEDIANSVKILGFEPDAEKIDWYANRKFIGNDEQKEMIYPKDATKRAEKFFWIAAELLQAAEIEPNNDNLKQFLKAAGIKNKILLERVEMAEPVIVIDAKL